MNAGIPAGNAGVATKSAWVWTPLVAIAAVVIGVVVIVDRTGVRETAQQLKTEQIDREDRALCERLGKAHGSEGFAACANVLSEARQRHAERFAAENRGF